MAHRAGTAGRNTQTLGGLPASAFVLAAPPATAPVASDSTSTHANTSAAGGTVSPNASSDVTTSGGTVNTIPLFSTATNIQNSILTQAGTTTINVGGKLNLPTTGAATATAGKNSRPQAFVASVFNSTTSTAVPQIFQWQAEPAGNDTSTARAVISWEGTKLLTVTEWTPTRAVASPGLSTATSTLPAVYPKVVGRSNDPGCRR